MARNLPAEESFARPGALQASQAEERVSLAPSWKLVWWRFRKHHLAMASGAVLILLYLVVIFPDFFSTQDPEATVASQAFIPVQRVALLEGWRFHPSVPVISGKRNPVTLRMEWQVNPSERIPVHLFVHGYRYSILGVAHADIHLLGTGEERALLHLLGTDRLGRDQWSRLMHGTRTSMTVGLIAVAISVILGALLGGVSGYFGGWVDLGIQRLVELLQSLPTIPIWLAMTAALPQDWPPQKVFFAITVILALIGWTTLARELRGRFLSLREEEFVLAAELAGCSRFRVITRHMLPAVTSHLIATSTLAIPVLIISETSLSYLGLGMRPPAISWGVLLQEAQNIQTIATAPWLLIPGIVVITAVLAFNLVGDGLRDAADPYGH